MDDSQENSGLVRSWPWWRWGLTGLSALALALCAYLSWHYLTGGTVIGCGGGSSCQEVLSSRWSAIGGVLPVSGLAAGVYLALLVASFFVGPSTAERDRQLAWGAMLVLVGAAAGSAVWFFIVQRWMVGALCPYCMATHVTGLLLAVLVLARALAGRGVGRLPAVVLPVVGLGLAGILSVTQVLLTPQNVYKGGEMRENGLPALDPHAVPLVGSPDAPYVVTLLFDYKCPHCQKTHEMLEEVMARYHGKLAFALCPAPLNTQCNPYISRQVDEFKDSCDLARLGMAVWVADRRSFAVFDDWMFTPEPGHDLWHPKSLESAKAKAVELLGQAKLDAALADPWIGRYMQTSIRIYGDTILPDQSGNAVPKLVFRSRWATPQPTDANDLFLILQKSLGLPRP